MKLIHCADIHLDSAMSANFTGEQAALRRKELLGTFLKMIETGEAQGVGAVLISGDLFDSKRVSLKAANFVKDAICAHPKMLFFYLKGNHDLEGFVSQEERPSNLYTFTDNWVSYLIDEENHVAAPLTPEIKKREGINLNSRCVVTGAELTGADSNTLYAALSLPSESFNIVMLHGQEASYNVKDRAEVIPLGELKARNIDYLALGHIHSYKKEQLDARGVYVYPGCLEARGFDECGEHGFVLVDTGEDGALPSYRFVPFAQRKAFEIEVDVSDCACTADALENVESVLKSYAAGEDDMVHILLYGETDIESGIDPDFISKKLEDRFYLLRVKDMTRTKINYEAFERDASLKGEFIRRVRTCSDLSEDEKTEIIRYGIRALSGEEIL